MRCLHVGSAVLVMLAVASTASNAQVGLTGGVSLGYAAPPTTDTGGAFTGWVGAQSRLIRVQLLGDLIVSENEDSPYYVDEFENGESACRDSRNGQFADEARCGPEADPAVRGELLLRVGRRVLVGPGYRVAEGSSIPYGAAGYEAAVGRSAAVLLRGAYGANYMQFDVGLSF